MKSGLLLNDCTTFNYHAQIIYSEAMYTLGPAKSVLIFQVILYEKVPFRTLIKCLDYAGILIFKCPHSQVPLYSKLTANLKLQHASLYYQMKFFCLSGHPSSYTLFMLTISGWTSISMVMKY